MKVRNYANSSAKVQRLMRHLMADLGVTPGDYREHLLNDICYGLNETLLVYFTHCQVEAGEHHAVHANDPTAPNTWNDEAIRVAALLGEEI